MSMSVAAFWSHPEPSWKQLGFQDVPRCLQVGSKRPQDGSMLAQVGLQTPKLAPEGSQYEPTWPQDGIKIDDFKTNSLFFLIFKNIEKT